MLSSESQRSSTPSLKTGRWVVAEEAVEADEVVAVDAAEAVEVEFSSSIALYLLYFRWIWR